MEKETVLLRRESKLCLFSYPAVVVEMSLINSAQSEAVRAEPDRICAESGMLERAGVMERVV